MGTTEKKPLFSAITYDRLKWCAQVGFPALGTLYFALAQIWGLPNPEGVTGTILALDTFLGVVLHIDTKTYNASDAKFDGSLIVDNSGVEGSTDTTHAVTFKQPVENLEGKSELTLKVENPKMTDSQ